MRLGDAIDGLVALAAQLPDGRDAEIVAGACDGRGLATTADVEITTMTRVGPDGTSRPPTGLLRVHAHGDGVEYLPGVAESSG